MKSVAAKLAVALAALLLAISAFSQVFRYFTPGSIWTVTTIRVRAGMDPAYLQYLDGQFKKENETEIKAGYMKSYKVLQSMDDDASSWNLLILREYASLGEMEADEEKSDKVAREALGENDQTEMQGYEDRSKVREILATRTVRELKLK